MARNYADWLQAFVDHASVGEAPKYMYFWAGVSAVAGALRRRVWIHKAIFTWYPNFYIILVAPPGIVSKSTTASVSMNLLRQVPGIKFGPDVVTWQALVTGFADSAETFLLDGSHYTMSALTLESSEFGNLLNPSDRDMVDLLVRLWDGKEGVFLKKTKGSGNDSVVNGWINVIACTTPAWIAGNFPDYMVGGGFTSRCVFVYAEQKEKLVAYPEEPRGFKDEEVRLIQDLEHIAMELAGPYQMSPEAVAFGEHLYAEHFGSRPVYLDEARFGAYRARKQTHIHKLAMVLAASRRDELLIEKEDLDTANQMVTNLEPDLPKVFAKMGQAVEAVAGERLLEYVVRKGGCAEQEAHREVWFQFPNQSIYNETLSGLVHAGLLVQTINGSRTSWLKPTDFGIARFREQHLQTADSEQARMPHPYSGPSGTEEAASTAPETSAADSPHL